jgi:acyl-coenzyme A synthetase/AMP-(fatty) acid ligase
MNSEGGVQPQNDPSIVAVEWALIAHPAVVEAAALGSAQAGGAAGDDAPLRVYVVLDGAATADEAQRMSLTSYVQAHLGETAPAMEIVFVDALPKTRTGKVARWMLNDPASD